MRARAGRAGPIAAALAAIVLASTPGAVAGPSFSAALTTTWDTDGTVFAVARSGSSIYLGGDFRYVGPHTGGGAFVRRSDAAIDSSFPSFDGGAVAAVVGDGSGGYFVGGTFRRVGTHAISYLAHVLASGAVDPSFDAHPDQPVYRLARLGSSLYVGGLFGTIGGAERQNLAAVSTSSGTALAWDPGLANGIEAITVIGSTVYVAGQLTFNNLQTTQQGVSAIDATTGAVLAFHVAGSGVTALATSGSTLYVGGSWQESPGGPTVDAAAFDTTSGQKLAWNPPVSHEVVAMAHDNGVVYLVTNTPTPPSGNLYAFDDVTGNAAAGFSRPTVTALSIAVATGVLYAGVTDDPDPTGSIVAYDAGTGAAVGSSVSTEKPAGALYADATNVVAGGSFLEAGGVVRRGLAELDAGTGTATSFDPELSDSGTPTVRGLALVGNRLYFGGRFTSAGGSPRANLAALDVSSNALLSWTPQTTVASGTLTEVFKLAASAVGVYVDGTFSSRTDELAGFDPSGTMLPFAGRVTSANFPVAEALHATATAVYVGGSFSSAGGSTRTNLAALDPITGDALPMNLTPGEIRAIAVDGNTLYVAGNIGFIDGTYHASSYAAVDTTTNAVSAFSTAAPLVRSLTAGGGMLFGIALSDSNLFAIDTQTGGWKSIRLGGPIGASVTAEPDGSWVGVGLTTWLNFTLPADDGLQATGFASFDVTPGTIAAPGGGPGGGGGSGGGGGGGGGGSAPLDLATIVTASANEIGVGGSPSIRIDVHDATATPATHLHVLVTLPRGANVLVASTDRGPGCVATEAAGTFDCNLDYLSGFPSDGHILFVVTLSEAGLATVTATAHADQSDINPANDTGTTTVQVDGPPPPGPPPPPPLARPRLTKVVGRALATVARGLTENVAGRFRVNEPATLTLVVRATDSRRTVKLLAASRMGPTTLRRAVLTLKATVTRAGVVLYRIRLATSSLHRGRSYVVKVTATNRDGRSGALTFGFRA